MVACDGIAEVRTLPVSPASLADLSHSFFLGLKGISEPSKWNFGWMVASYEHIGGWSTLMISYVQS